MLKHISYPMQHRSSPGLIREVSVVCQRCSTEVEHRGPQRPLDSGGEVIATRATHESDSSHCIHRAVSLGKKCGPNPSLSARAFLHHTSLGLFHTHVPIWHAEGLIFLPHSCPVRTGPLLSFFLLKFRSPILPVS